MQSQQAAPKAHSVPNRCAAINRAASQGLQLHLPLRSGAKGSRCGLWICSMFFIKWRQWAACVPLRKWRLRGSRAGDEGARTDLLRGHDHGGGVHGRDGQGVAGSYDGASFRGRSLRRPCQVNRRRDMLYNDLRACLSKYSRNVVARIKSRQSKALSRAFPVEVIVNALEQSFRTCGLRSPASLRQLRGHCCRRGSGVAVLLQSRGRVHRGKRLLGGE